MANFCVITNNPLSAEKYPGVSVLLKTDVEGIFKAARDRIHLGALILGHPLSGSVKPNESPYKSLVLSQPGDGFDMQSLQLIEGALAVLYKLGVKNRAYPERVLTDFRVIDLDLLDSAIKGLPPVYHF